MDRRRPAGMAPALESGIAALPIPQFPAAFPFAINARR
jgi:hypothetical protein